MSNALTKPPRTPSPRDLDVYKRVKIWRLPQWEVAYDLKVHYSWVSKIVKRVQRWLALGGDPIDPEIRDFAARQQLAETTARLRLTRAIELATVAMEIKPDPEPIVRRRLVNGVEVWREETEKPVPNVDLKALRAVVSATSALHRLDNQIAQPAPEHIPQQSTPEKLLAAVIDLLTNLRLQAESDGQVPTTADAHLTVVTTLRTLLGDSLCSHHAPRDVPEISEQSSHHAPRDVPEISQQRNSVPGSSLGLHQPEAPVSSTASMLSFPGSSLGTQEPEAPASSNATQSSDPLLSPSTSNSPPQSAGQETVNLTNLNVAPNLPNPSQPITSSSAPLTAVK